MSGARGLPRADFNQKILVMSSLVRYSKLHGGYTYTPSTRTIFYKIKRERCPETTKKAMLGKMVTNDLSESSFTGVMPQVQTYGRIGMFNVAAIIDM